MAKKKKVSIYGDYQQVQEALREIGELDIKIEAEEAKVTKQVNAIREKAQEVVSPLSERKKLIEENVQLFIEEKKKEDFADKKSMDLVFGEVGFRQTGGGVHVKSNKSTVDALLGLGARFKHLISTEHKPNKEALEGMDDDFLKQVGASRKKKTDKFWYVVNREKLSQAD
ncbi:hypothetical protein AJ85_05750 [Alkalihalobacillus alcalophilus ATCC 27647 = CGMCC 1.3604]|uniref:Host-nuclease inhibitor protein Gam n=1 Tax=Alkalihalobacillus alcalophilus ATCC 27647 = CGMCC 1.3604 TaxID=1218173 RepID=A0A094XDK3_ALKAL|nr:host-nuclease inhibitor Gam family protein [Alkalihalobacillus alcalophilus]YP_009276821.1 Mu Gam-like end protection [Bacillus phage BalMu-1]AJA42393.1 host-nuclease inhibitor protein Gam2C putative [Bacillus phage BalMu-1]AJA42449.1 host-nuclease inhibitor protein Gam2C putative [Bacillus phage BalMu-1]KGA96850.1 hypothetical protein BALCAV_0213600 [Alkalihalobacillus alcalophilus ATCC 27647 = CGMCC 1.3604]MED1561137.1 host-nuclease inhibitor Gam family protein [Alkalihalobacillus alcalop